jgi:hypothetical protein
MLTKVKLDFSFVKADRTGPAANTSDGWDNTARPLLIRVRASRLSRGHLQSLKRYLRNLAVLYLRYLAT